MAIRIVTIGGEEVFTGPSPFHSPVLVGTILEIAGKFYYSILETLEGETHDLLVTNPRTSLRNDKFPQTRI